MRAKRVIPYLVESIDSLGQGVSKLDGKVTFIAKTLPGERGEAEVFSERKGVAFAQLQSISAEAPERILPVCPHFDLCPSCHFLHTTYEQELKFKQKSLEKIFFKVPLPTLKVVPAPARTAYRNRIQLHYDTKMKLMGMLNTQINAIVPIPQCLIALPEIQVELKKLYTDDLWLKLAPRETSRGHLEIYFKDGLLKTSWNKPYADGGFTQVYAAMNSLLKIEIQKWYEQIGQTDLVDLFAGNGNISQDLNYSQRLCVDIYNETTGPDFFSQSLYASDALNNVKKILKARGIVPEVLIIDPPRSGMKDLNGWLDELKPKHLAYVSCDPHTLARDIFPLTEHYQLKELVMFDFFPSTFHFETLIFLERK